MSSGNTSKVTRPVCLQSVWHKANRTRYRISRWSRCQVVTLIILLFNVLSGVVTKMPNDTKTLSFRRQLYDMISQHVRQYQDYSSYFYACVKYTSLSLFLIYIAVPIFVRANQWILPKVVFSNLIRWPPFTNLSQPSDFGLRHTNSFSLHVEDGIDIGAWHILPQSVVSERGNIALEDYYKELSNGKKVFLYLHGNTGTRGAHHRVQLYKLLSGLDFHVIVIDYRGYGDSTGYPTEDGVVTDSYFTYKWLKERVGESNIFLWGHSLGTGVTTKLAKKLCDEGDHPSGIVLESPFNNIQDAAVHHPLAQPFRLLPWFRWIFVDGLGQQGIHFSSDENILSVAPHIMILHAKDDFVVPFHLGESLYQSATRRRPGHLGEVQFVAFEAHHGFGHKLIYQAPDLPGLIREFVAKAKTRT